MVVGSAILVTYNSVGSIEPCLRAICYESGWERIVVDNASHDQSSERARAADPGARIVQNCENLGFAANRGAQFATGAILLFLNPDAVARPGALRALVAALQSPDVGAASGLLLRDDGQPDRGFSVRRFPTTSAMAAEILLFNRLWPGNPVNRRYRCLDLDYARSIEVINPLVVEFPQNPVFQLLLADDHAKLNHKEAAEIGFRAAAAMPISNAACAARIRKVVSEAIALLTVRTK